MNALSEKVYAFTQKNRLLSLPCTLIVGVSGGADSMALLHVLSHWPDFGLKLYVVHVNHGLRGEEAERDASFVASYCSENGIPHEVVYADVKAVSRSGHIGIEEAGRRVRYEIFSQVAAREGADAIAVAHTASDQAETVLLHLSRGCGIEGLCGMAPRRDDIVRPLLCCTRQEIEDYCAAEGIKFITDSTNDDISYARNRVRHRVLPALRSINPACDAAILRLSSSATEDSSYLFSIAVSRLDEAKLPRGGYRLDAFDVEAPIRRRMVRELLISADCRSAEEIHYIAIDDALSAEEGAVSLPGGWRLTVHRGLVEVKSDSESLISFESRTVEWTESFYEFSAGQNNFKLQLCNKAEWGYLKNVHKMFFKYSVDYDKIQGSLQIRGRQAGDRLRLAGRNVSKTVKKLMAEDHVCASYRGYYPLLTDECGVVLVPGIGCDERVAPDVQTERYLVWLTNGEPCDSVIRIFDPFSGLSSKE